MTVEHTHAERIPPDLAPHAVPIAGLVPYPGNAKLHDLDVIRQSLRDHGQYRLAVVQESTGHVLVGNGMLEAARLEGWSEARRPAGEGHHEQLEGGDLVLDLFGGSGSTLIACHLHSRVARLVELDPRYCDVICRRFQQVTGDTPVRESTGEPVDFEPATVG